MAVLKNLDTGERLILRARHRFGRSRTNHTALHAAEVSGEHALIGYTSDGWELRDLGSRNGTWLDGTALAPGERRALAPGAQIGFGADTPQWQVVSEAPPSAFARSGDRLVEGDGDLLALPSQDDPQLVVRYDEEEGWIGDDGPVGEGTPVKVAGERWVLGVPEILAPTRELGPSEQRLHDARLRFAVSRDEEYVEVTVEGPQGALRLPPKAHHYLLLTLARAYLADLDAGTAPADAGWRHTEDVQRMLRASKNQIYVSVHRIKKELTERDLVDGASIVQRRKTSGQLRIGVFDLEISSLS